MKQGFTLLEILIAVGILATMGTLIVQVFFTTTRVNTKTELVKDINGNAEFAIDVIERMVRSASKNSTTCAVGDLTTGSLVIENPDGETTTFSCVSDGTVARIASVSAASTDYLTNANLTLSATGKATCDDSSLTFSCPSLTDPIVTIGFSLGQPGSSPNSFETARYSFTTSVTQRNPQ